MRGHLASAALISLLAVGCLEGTERPPCASTGRVGTACGFENPEDLEQIEPDGAVVVSNIRTDRTSDGGGYLSVFEPATGVLEPLWPTEDGAPARHDPALGHPACTEPPSPGSFSPHGIASRSTGDDDLLFVVGHKLGESGREAVEIFRVVGQGEDLTLDWTACVPTVDEFLANDVAVGSDGTIVVSRFLPHASTTLLLRASLLGTHTGDIMSWRPEQGWRSVPGTAASLPNGVAVNGDASMVFYGEYTTRQIHRVPIDGSGGAISVALEGSPDNLTWTDRGTLLVATQTKPLALALCMLGRRPCRAAWAVYEIDPATLSVSSTVEHDGSAVGAVSTALQVGKALLLGAVFDDRIGVVHLR